MIRRCPLVLAALFVVVSCSSSGSENLSPPTDSTAPVASGPDSTDPPATDPPATDPPATDQPATDPPATDPAVTEPTDTSVAEPELERMVPALGFLRAEPDPIAGGRIVDDQGREVLLRGVNVNSYAEYWSGNDFPTVFPFGEEDADRIASIGWNSVRLLFTWSSVEPEPGVYDEAYIDTLEGVVRLLESRGIYTILDAHQDAWGPTLAARPDEACDEGSIPAVGWDGAPGWATLVDDATPRCAAGGVRETSPAVREAWASFFADAEGPGGVGVRTRYVQMWGHLAERFAHDPAVAGYDIMNEPNAFTGEEQDQLGQLYEAAIVEIRAAEDRVDGTSHMVLFEPWPLWWSLGGGLANNWEYDSNVVYSPHIYEGAFTGAPVTRGPFELAIEEAAQFGGAPVLTGEWGTAFENHYGTQRTGPDGDGYFVDHLSFQDEFRIHSTIWEWRESCGDPHKVKPEPIETQRVSGIYEVDCATNEIVAERTDLISDLTWAYPHRAPGSLADTDYDPATGAFEAVGFDAAIGTELVVFYPISKHAMPAPVGDGLDNIEVRPGPDGGVFITATTTESAWGLRV